MRVLCVASGMIWEWLTRLMQGFFLFSFLCKLIGQPRFLAAVSTSGAAHTQGQSRAPRQQRSRWNNSWTLAFDFFSTSIQTILLVVFLPVFRDEPAHAVLQGWVTGTGAGCVLNRTYKCFRAMQSNRLPQAISVSPGFEVGELQTGRRQRYVVQLNWWF